MENFEKDMAEVLEVDTVELDDELSGFDCWDSLTILSIIALADENYSVTLSAAEINDAKTIGNLKKLIISKK
ncbi:MAG: phosphopantetheine-binding protein [Bacteroidales bacterium]|jgi:acyl carrier protein|nr:phosphopantetheine-binding protein [Bacteroidales bacterium]